MRCYQVGRQTTNEQQWKIVLPELIFVTDITDISVEKNLSCGEISDFYKEFEQFMEFLSKFMPFFVQICVEKNLAQKCVCGEKMTNIRYDHHHYHHHHHHQHYHLYEYLQIAQC